MKEIDRCFALICRAPPGNVRPPREVTHDLLLCSPQLPWSVCTSSARPSSWTSWRPGRPCLCTRRPLVMNGLTWKMIRQNGRQKWYPRRTGVPFSYRFSSIYFQRQLLIKCAFINDALLLRDGQGVRRYNTRQSCKMMPLPSFCLVLRSVGTQ